MFLKLVYMFYFQLGLNFILKIIGSQLISAFSAPFDSMIPTPCVCCAFTSVCSEYEIISPLVNLDHRQTNLTVRVRPRDVMKFTRSVIPYIYCNVQRATIGIF